MIAHSVKLKILFSILFIILCVVSIFMYFASERAISQRLSYLITTNDILAENQSRAAILPLWNIDYAAVKGILRALSDTPDFVIAKFYDDKGYVIAEERNPDVARDVDVHKIVKDIHYNYQNENLYLGRLEFVVSLQSIKRYAVNELKWGLVVLLSIACVLTVLLMVLLHFFITRPLGQLATTFAKISTGDTSVEIPFLKRKDEMGQLVQAAQVFQKKSTSLVEYERAKTEKAQVANQEKNTFLMRISHELRTPLNGIMGFADMLMRSPLPKANQDQAHTILKLGNKMLMHVDDLLDFSGIENNKINLVTSPVNWRNMIGELLESVSETEEDSTNELLFTSDIDIPDEISMDARRVEQVLRHLVRNAYKFTKDGCILVNVDKLEQSSNNIRLRFSVTDNGEGIDKEFQKRMFEEFAQEDESETRRFGGIGMGLSISSGFLKLMNSQIQVESQKGEGSKFYFDLSLPVANPSTGFSVIKSPSVNVWVWDVSLDWREAVMDQFYRFGFNAKGFDDLSMMRKQLKLLPAQQQAIVIVNLRYIVGDVKDKLTEIAKDSRCRLYVLGYEKQLPKLPINLEDCFVSKPITTQKLFALAADFSNQGKKVDEGNSHEISENMRILVVEDDLVNQKLATTMLEKMGHIADVAENGKIAVEMVAESVYDLILMDMMMPVMDGLQATRAIRRFRGEKGDVPIIAVTANAYETDKENCFNAGMNGFVTKPYDIGRLKSEIVRVVSLKAS